MKEPKFKKGEWCFCEFTLQQVMETEENRITSVSDGFLRLSGNDLTDRCFPLTLEMKIASDNVEHYSKEFHKLNNNALNYPDLNRELISRWVDICENIGNKKLLQRRYDSLSEWAREVQRKVRSLESEYVGDVKLFR